LRPRTLLALAWRESRFARRRLLLFLSAISLGVAALVAVQGFASNLSRGVRDQARALLGADAAFVSRQPFGERTEAVLDSLRAGGVPVARVTSFASMALHPATGATRLVQVRAPEPGFPFYGEIRTRPEGLWPRMQQGRNIVVDPGLMISLGAQPGDSLSIGEARFRILGALDRVPGDVEIASAFAPRVFLPAAHLDETRLVGFGSRIDYEAFVRLPAAGEADRLVAAYRPVLRAERTRLRTAEEQQQSLEEALGRLSSYLGLIGVFALLLGGIGVASAMRAYMAQKVDTVAVLRCLGATARQVFGIYLLQAAMMGLAGALLGVALGVAVQWVLPWLAAGLLPVDVDLRPDGLAVATGLVVGVWTALIFALLPLLQVRRVSPLGALRRQVEPLGPARGDPLRWTAWAALGASVVLLLVLQLRDLRVGLGVAGGVAATTLVLWLAAIGVMRLVRRLPRERWAYTVRQGVANLYRPGNQTPTVVLALGFGVFLIATLLLTQHNLLRPLRVGDEATRANLLLWDVQEDQQAPLASLLRDGGFPVLQQAPIVPMRIAAINGQEVRPFAGGQPPEDEVEEGGPGQPSGWAVRREYRSTYRDSIVASEQLLAGRWWEPGTGDGAQVSLERDVATELGVNVGDRIDWDVQGVRIPTVVTSLREVDWARFEPNFFAVFPAAALEAAPQTWVMLTRAETPEARARVQGAVVERFSNVSAVDLTLVQEALDDVIGRVSTVIRFLAAFSIATGFVVLLGAIATNRLQRIRESVLLKALGATRRQIAAILFSEYLVLGLLAALTGILLATGAGWALARWVFNVPFEVAPLPLAALGLAVATLAVAIGLWASQEVFSHTPLEAIREE
jgi:putative ABC transport system permease protein